LKIDTSIKDVLWFTNVDDSSLLVV
jgi:hypothetical protein